MVKIKKLVLFGIVSLFLIQIAYAVDVGYVVQFPDTSVQKGCVDVSQDTNGYNLLQATGLSLLWSDYSTYGHGLCRINGVGDDVVGSGCAYSGNCLSVRRRFSSCLRYQQPAPHVVISAAGASDTGSPSPWSGGRFLPKQGTPTSPRHSTTTRIQRTPRGRAFA